MLLSIAQEVSGSIPGSAVGFLFSGELFHGTHGLVVSVFFVIVLSYFVLFCRLRNPFTLLTSG
jgi:hypothetical protein